MIMAAYVIPKRGSHNVPISTVLEDAPDVIFLDELDTSTALAEMSDEAYQQIIRQLRERAHHRAE